MEGNKIYKDIVYLTYNIFKNEKTRASIVLEPIFEEKLLILINDILLLEKDYDIKLQDRTWFADFGKTIVNIVQKKLKFEKEDNKKMQDVDNDYTDIINYIKNDLNVNQAEIELNDFLLNAEDLKKYQTVSPDLLDKYRSKVEVINDNEKVFQNNNSGSTSNMNSDYYNNSSNKGTIGSDPMTSGNLFMNDRFYPYRTKPEKMKLMRIILFVCILVAGFTMVLSLIGQFVYSKTITFDQLFNNVENKNDIFANFIAGSGYTKDTAFIFGSQLSFSSSGSYMTIISTALYLFLIVYVGYKLISRPRNYKEYYYTPSWIIFILLIFFGFDLFETAYNNSKSNALTWDPNNISSVYIKAFEQKDLFFNSDGISKITTDVEEIIRKNVLAIFDSGFKSKYQLFLVFSILFYIGSAAAIVTSIFAICYNPKMDREKVMRLQMEIQKQVAMAMQGQKYEIDQSLFVPQDEYDRIMDKIKPKENKNDNIN